MTVTMPVGDAVILTILAAAGAAAIITAVFRRHRAAPPPGAGALSPKAAPTPPRPSPGTGPARCSLCGWHKTWCNGCGRRVAVQRPCPAHEQAPL